jgi:hypothetical protein
MLWLYSDNCLLKTNWWKKFPQSCIRAQVVVNPTTIWSWLWRPYKRVTTVYHKYISHLACWQGWHGHHPIVVRLLSWFISNCCLIQLCGNFFHQFVLSRQLSEYNHSIYYLCNQCLSPLKLWVRTPRHNWNIVESGIKHHKSPSSYMAITFCKKKWPYKRGVIS